MKKYFVGYRFYMRSVVWVICGVTLQIVAANAHPLNFKTNEIISTQPEIHRSKLPHRTLSAFFLQKTHSNSISILTSLRKTELPVNFDLNLMNHTDSSLNFDEQYIQSLDEKLRANAKDVTTRSKLAETLTVMRRFQDATFHFEYLLNETLSTKTRSAVLNNYGNMFFLEDSIDNAERSFRSAISADSTHKEIHLNLGVLYTAIDSTNMAIAMNQKFIQGSLDLNKAEEILGYSPTIYGNGKSSKIGDKRKKTNNLRRKVRMNLRKSVKSKGRGRINRPTGRKADFQLIGVNNYDDLEALLYWAKVGER